MRSLPAKREAKDHSSPSRRSLTIMVLLIVMIGITVPSTPSAGALSFTPLPALFFRFLIVATGTYLLLVEGGKRILMRRRSY